MFGSNIPNSGLTFSMVLNGISKTLSVANQVIPLYQQAKPMINNAKTIINTLKDIKKNDSPKPQTKITENETKNISPIATTITNSPIFFQ